VRSYSFFKNTLRNKTKLINYGAISVRYRVYSLVRRMKMASLLRSIILSCVACPAVQNF